MKLIKSSVCNQFRGGLHCTKEKVTSLRRLSCCLFLRCFCRFRRNNKRRRGGERVGNGEGRREGEKKERKER